MRCKFMVKGKKFTFDMLNLLVNYPDVCRPVERWVWILRKGETPFTVSQKCILIIDELDINYISKLT